MDKYYLGFNLGFNASACLISNKRGVVSAISQERLSNEKNTKKIPIDAMLKCCEIANVKRLDGLSYSHYQTLTRTEIYKYIPVQYKKYIDANGSFYDALRSIFSDNGIECVIDSELARTEHHESHMASCFAIYGEPESYYGITSDGFGDGISGRIVSKLNGKTKVISQVDTVNSIGLLYQFVTGALGYTMHQHEGKITGLAAYGFPYYISVFEQTLYDANGEIYLNKLLDLNDEEKAMVNVSAIIDFDKFLRLKKTVFKMVEDLLSQGASPMDIAASLQEFSERMIFDWIKANVEETKEKKICFLAGGLFANVKINQRVKETNLFSEVKVSPPMGDEGTAMGSAYINLKRLEGATYFEDKQFTHPFKNATSGTTMKTKTNVSITKDQFYLLESRGMDVKMYEDENELLTVISDALASKEIVCLCQGKMEFGPRALCHRSILYDCTENATNNWLNRQLGRTEFMPFAPVCRDIDAKDLFYDMKGGEQSAKFMTMTFDCSNEFVNTYTAACHVDNTARPQVINEVENNFMYKLMNMYYNKTGLKVLINTSFNLHSFPIIESTYVAIESWLKSNTHMLVIENIVIRKNK